MLGFLECLRGDMPRSYLLAAFCHVTKSSVILTPDAHRGRPMQPTAPVPDKPYEEVLIQPPARPAFRRHRNGAVPPCPPDTSRPSPSWTMMPRLSRNATASS